MSITFYSNTNEGPNFSNDNAFSILKELNIITNEEEMWDIETVEIATIMRGCMKVLNTNKIYNTRPKEFLNIVGHPEVYDNGLDENGLIRRIEVLQTWLKEQFVKGNTNIYWS